MSTGSVLWNISYSFSSKHYKKDFEKYPDNMWVFKTCLKASVKMRPFPRTEKQCSTKCVGTFTLGFLALHNLKLLLPLPWSLRQRTKLFAQLALLRPDEWDKDLSYDALSPLLMGSSTDGDARSKRKTANCKRLCMKISGSVYWPVSLDSPLGERFFFIMVAPSLLYAITWEFSCKRFAPHDHKCQEPPRLETHLLHLH